MKDLKEYIDEMMKEATVAEKADPELIVSFLDDNDWFGNPPSLEDGKVLLTEQQIACYNAPLLFFLQHEGTSDVLLGMLKEKFPETHGFLTKFFADENVIENTRFSISDFLLYHLEKELCRYNNKAATLLVKAAAEELTKYNGDMLTFFLAWLRTETKTAYSMDFIMEKRYTLDDKNGAYEFDEYIELAYYLFHKDYVEENEMYALAAESKNYIDTWLYLSLHFICSLRYTDLVRIYHPDLPYEPEEVLRKIKEGEFGNDEARAVLLSLTTRMCMLPFTPNKTSDKSGISFVKFLIPDSCEVHFGRLFAIAEAHWRIANDKTAPLIRRVTRYEDITRYMGEEIGSLFLERDFSGRSANKSYLQLIYAHADDILGEDGPRMKGYILAALARSHKGSYEEFAATTWEYIKDAKLSGLTPEFVVFELLERGVLSNVSSMLLKLITNKEYNDLSVKNQTALVKALGLTPFEIEHTTAVVQAGQDVAKNVVSEVLQSPNVSVLEALHNIGNGDAYAKQPECLCLRTAMHKSCIDVERRQCIGCKYEISTKSTLYLLVAEYTRLSDLYNKAVDPLEKSKNKKIFEQIIMPKLGETLKNLKENYGDEVYHEYEQMIGKALRQ